MSIKFLVLGGGGAFWVLGGGGGCRFYFYGRGDFSEKNQPEVFLHKVLPNPGRPDPNPGTSQPLPV